MQPPFIPPCSLSLAHQDYRTYLPPPLNFPSQSQAPSRNFSLMGTPLQNGSRPLEHSSQHPRRLSRRLQNRARPLHNRIRHQLIRRRNPPLCIRHRHLLTHALQPQPGPRIHPIALPTATHHNRRCVNRSSSLSNASSRG